MTVDVARVLYMSIQDRSDVVHFSIDGAKLGKVLSYIYVRYHLGSTAHTFQTERIQPLSSAHSRLSSLQKVQVLVGQHHVARVTTNIHCSRLATLWLEEEKQKFDSWTLFVGTWSRSRSRSRCYSDPRPC